jgi:succinylarginine dihydrolase
VFHNDVVAVGNRDVFFFHEQAIADKDRVLDQIRRTFAQVCGSALKTIEVPASAVSIEDAVSSYLFNSQLVTLPDGATALIAPTECLENPLVKSYVDEHIRSPGSAIQQVHFVDVRQSMQNGGGPACLRLRVELTEAQLARVHAGVMFTSELHEQLMAWVERHYREKLELNDLRDPKLLEESRDALQALGANLKLPLV